MDRSKQHFVSPTRITTHDERGWKDYRFHFALLCLVLLAGISCAPPETADSEPEDQGLTRTFERGPIAVTLRLDRTQLTIAERLNLTIEITADEDYEVDLPQFGENLEQFGIVDYRTTEPVLTADNKTRRSRSYVLEPFLSGDYTIPPMTFRFRKTDETEDHEMATEELAVKVVSLLPENLAELKIHEIGDPVALPREPKRWLWAVLTAIGLLVLVAGLIVWLRRRRQPVALPPPTPPHEIAFALLQELVGEQLIENGKIKLFYQRISGILRNYIENRFNLSAPEQTTEEFLYSLQGDQRLPENHKQLLDQFLHHCDRVKFAEHQPSEEEIQKSFDHCKAFIMETESPAEPQPSEVHAIESEHAL